MHEAILPTRSALATLGRVGNAPARDH